ncbi:unnamed protein product [Scytosiphon promiscuus]
MEALEQLTSMGFSEDAARIALEAHGGSPRRALDALLGVAEDPASQQVICASISQYDVENGRSSCTCICLEASLSILERLGDSTTWAGSPEDVANYVNVGVAMYEAVVAAGNLAVEHTSVAEILATVARYRDTLQPATARTTHQGMLGSDRSIARVIGEIRSMRQERQKPVAVVITKPPETVVCVLPVEVSSDGDARTASGSGQWSLFDSHPRPQLGLVGASVRSFGREEALVEALDDIFPAVELDTDSVMANMYNMFDCIPLSLRREN